MSLFSRLLALIITIGIAPLIPTGALLIYYQKQAKQNVLDTHHGFAIATSTSIYQHMENLNQRLVFYKRLKNALLQNKKNQAQNILKSAMQSNQDFLLTAILDKNGREDFKIGTAAGLKNIGEIERGKSNVFLTAKQTGKIALSNFKLVGQLPTAEIIMPLTRDDYLFMIVDFLSLWSRVKRQKIGLTGRIYLADASGMIFNFYSKTSLDIDPDFLKEEFKSKDTGKLLKIPSLHSAFIGAYEKVPNFNLYVVTLQLKKEAFWAITLTTSLILFLVFTISTAAYFAAWVFASKISLPLSNLTDGAERVSKQDFSIPVSEIKSFVELEQLIKSFNAMMKEIKKYNDLQIDKVLEEKNKTDLLIKLMRDGLVLADNKGRMLYSNDIAKSIIKSRDFPAGFYKKNKNTISSLVKNILENKKIPDILKLRIGTNIDYHYYKLKSSIYDKSLKEQVIIIVFHDITLEHKIDKMKEDFFNSVAHDLRAPLVGLQGYIKLLAMGKFSKTKQKQYLQSMDSSAQKVTALIEDILDISKIQSGTLVLNKQNFDFKLLLEEAITPLQPAAKEKKLKLELVGFAKPIPVNADRRLIERVLSNLLSNAIKYTPKSKKITVSCKSLGRLHKFSIKDEGRGIEKDKLDKIFDKFYQTKEKDKTAGYGLGLSIVKEIVELHGGTIKAISKVGKGTTISFSLPK